MNNGQRSTMHGDIREAVSEGECVESQNDAENGVEGDG